MAHYCGADCQKAAWGAAGGHSAFHKMMKSKSHHAPDHPCGGFVETVVITLLELKAIGKKPSIKNDQGRLSLLFAGARTELQMDFKALFVMLKKIVYTAPDELRELAVCLCGPEASSYGASRHTEVTIEVIESTIQAAFRTPEALRRFDVAYLFAPGFSSYLTSWDEAMRLLLHNELQLPIVTTCISSLAEADNDALFDEDCLKTYWRANMLVPTTVSEKYMQAMFSRPPMGKNRYYMACQGVDEEKVEISHRDYKKRLVVAYMRYQAHCYKATEPSYSKSCEKICDMLERDELPYNEESGVEEYIKLANTMRC